MSNIYVYMLTSWKFHKISIECAFLGWLRFAGSKKPKLRRGEDIWSIIIHFWKIGNFPLFRLMNDICSKIIHFQKDWQNYHLPAMLLNLFQIPEKIIMVIFQKLFTVVQGWCLYSVWQARERIRLLLLCKDGLSVWFLNRKHTCLPTQRGTPIQGHTRISTVPF